MKRLIYVLCAAFAAATSVRADISVVDAGSLHTYRADAGAASWAWSMDGSSNGITTGTFTYAPRNGDVGTHLIAANETFASGSTATLQWLARVRIPVPASPIQYYVSTTGSDGNTGGIGSPFLTLEKARNVIRALPRPLPAGGVTVYLRGGTYWRAGTFTLTGSDSGSPGAPIIYTSYPGETAVLSTGMPIASGSFAPLAASEQGRVAPGVDVTRIWETDASNYVNKGPFPAHYGTWPVRNSLDTSTKSVPDVFYKDARAWLSRYPNHYLGDDRLSPDLKMDGIAADITGTGYLNSSGTYLTSGSVAVPVGGAFHYYPADADHVSRWITGLSHGGLWLQGFWRVTWQSDVAQVIGIDTVKQVIEFAPGSTAPGSFGNKYTRPLGNLKEPYWVMNLLEEMDQPGEWAMDFSRNKLYFLMDGPGAPPSGSVVVADNLSNVIEIDGSNVWVQSLTFDESLGVGVYIPGGSNNLVMGCSFKNMTNMAVYVKGGFQNGVVSCNLTEMGSTGIGLSATSNATTLGSCWGNYIVNTRMAGLSRYAQVYEPGVNVLAYTSSNRVSHNLIYDTPQMGVQFLGYQNLYEYNDIHKHGTLVDDTSAFYSFEDSNGNDTFRFNYSHDTPLSAAISYDGSTRTVSGHYFGNISQMDSACEGGSIGIGLLTSIDCVNNMSIGGGRYNSFNFTADHQCNINNNVAVQGYYPPDFHYTLLTVVNGSTVYTPTTAAVLANGPNPSYAYDPGFVDMANEDLRLRPDAQVLEDLPNFAPIPFELIGLYNDEFRTDGVAFRPFLTAGPGTYTSGTTASLGGTLIYPQFDPNNTVSIYYGPADSGTDPAAWPAGASLGNLGAGAFAASVPVVSATAPLYYRILVSNAGGQTWSGLEAAYPAPPAAPASLDAYAGDGSVGLYWSASSTADYYHIWRSLTTGSNYSLIATVNGSTDFINSPVVNSGTYYYVVSGVNGTGESGFSPEASAIPMQAIVSASSQDIGTTGSSGSASVVSGTYTLASSGAGIGGASDSFTLTSKQWSGDGNFVAHLVSFQSNNNSADAGIMLRDSFSANAANAFVGIDLYASQYYFSYRPSTGAGTVTGATVHSSLPRWFMITQSGTTYSAYTAPDLGATPGLVWGQSGSTVGIAMSTPDYAGLALDAASTGSRCTAVFDNVIFLKNPAMSAVNYKPALSWAGSQGAATYLIQRSTISGTGYMPVATLPGGVTSFTDYNAPSGATLYYNITAQSTQGWQVVTSSDAIFYVPDAPAGLTGTQSGPGQMSLSWGPAANASSYNLKRATMSGGPYTTVATVSGTMAVDTGLAGNTTYYYVVTGVGMGGEGPVAAEFPATTTPTPIQDASLALHLDASNGGTMVTGTGGRVSRWNDADFGPNYAAQASGSSQPAVMVGGTLGLNVADFGAYVKSTAGEWLQMTGSAGGILHISNIRTVFAVMQGGNFVLGDDGNTYHFHRALDSSGNCASGTLPLWNSTYASTAIRSGTTRYNGNVINGTTYAMPAGYFLVSVTSTANVEASRLACDRTIRTGGQQLGEVLIYTRALTDTERKATEAYLMWKWFHVDLAPPTITTPGNLIIEATGSYGAAVSFVTSAFDAISGTVPATNSPPSGSIFPLGTTLVLVTARDTAGNTGSSSFNITVRDTTPPAIVVPSGVSAYATTSTGAPVAFTTSAVDLVSGAVAAVNSPPSGSFFPIGATLVTTTGSDAAGNVAHATFPVTVSVRPIADIERGSMRGALTSGSYRITVSAAVPGRTYQLQRSDTLQTGSWINVGPVQTGNNLDLNFFDAYSGTQPRRFYRFQLGP